MAPAGTMHASHGASPRRGSTIESVLARARQAERILNPHKGEHGSAGGPSASDPHQPSSQELELMRALEELEVSISPRRSAGTPSTAASAPGGTPHSAKSDRTPISPLQGSVRDPHSFCVPFMMFLNFAQLMISVRVFAALCMTPQVRRSSILRCFSFSFSGYTFL